MEQLLIRIEVRLVVLCKPPEDNAVCHRPFPFYIPLIPYRIFLVCPQQLPDLMVCQAHIVNKGKVPVIIAVKRVVSLLLFVDP